MRHSLRALALIFLALVAGAGARASAQEITGTITGTVVDQTGAPLPGAVVSARHLEKGLSREVATSKAGVYTLPFLTTGPYEVTVSLSGFKTFVAKNITIHVNDRLELNATLGMQGVTESVEVTASAQLIQQTPAVQNLMGATQVQELPLNNRNFVQLATLVPGVSSDLSDEVGIGLTSTVSISINGGRRNAVNWLVDGASNVDVGSNITLLSTPTVDSIEEFKIITSSYSAEWPRSGGGVVNVVTKSGSNVFRGTAYEFFRDDSMNSNAYFRKQSTNPDIASKPPALDYHNFGYTLGGPIQKDKFFFFWSQEWRNISRAPTALTATVPDPTWLTDPANANYVAPALRDPNAVRLLNAWPAPNLPGANRYISNAPSDQDTRQEVLRLDYALSSKWRLMARYTHDLSKTVEAGGLFFGTAVPNVATTQTKVPGQVAVLQATTTINPTTLNEFTFQFSSNRIGTTNPDGTKNKRSDYSLNVPEVFGSNPGGIIPTVAITGLTSIGSAQLYSIEYNNFTFSDNISFVRGAHSIKAGARATFEQKNENANNVTQGSFSFTAGGGRTAFQNFLTGNSGGLCGTACSYSEAETDIVNHLRFNRYEFFVQDSWKAKDNLTLDLGVRYSIYPSPIDTNNVLTNFVPAQYSASRAPQFSSAAATALVVGTGSTTNGIVVAGQNSPYGRGIYGTDWGNIAPRVGFTWDPKGNKDNLVRGGFGVYYDQALVGIFEQSAFTNPPYVNTVTFQNPQFTDPRAGTPASTRGVPSLIATGDPFKTPRSMQWNLGLSRKLYARGVLDLGYVGSRGDFLIRPVDINQPQPSDVVRLGAVNLARPYQGYGSINMRQTTARSRYNGLTVNFRHEGGRNGTLNVAYTLSRNKTDASNDRDAVDLPQNPLDLGAEYAIARTDRTHILAINFVYELPFFREARGFAKQALGGWQISGIGNYSSGPPVSRIVTGNTNGSRRGLRVDQISDPRANLPANPVGGVYWFNPAAFTVPLDGAYGNSKRANFRLPGRKQWDLTVSKNWYPTSKTRLQFRADFINAFDTVQFAPGNIQNVCNAATAGASCNLGSTDSFGLITGTRAPREIQLGLKFFWN